MMAELWENSIRESRLSFMLPKGCYQATYGVFYAEEHTRCVALTAVLLGSGCIGVGGEGTTPAAKSPTDPAPSASESSPTDPLTPTTTPPGGSSPPSIDGCQIGDVPDPGPVDDVAPSPYPDPPANVTDDTLREWIQSFEMAYFRNVQLGDESEDDEYNLTSVDVGVGVRNVTHTEQTSLIRLSVSGGKTYASGSHADVWTTTGYVITDTRVVRVPLQYYNQSIRPENGTVVASCQ